MKLKKVCGLLTIGLALILLAACGQKSAQDIIKTELKDSYTGYSEESGYEGSIFKYSGHTLIFDKKKNTIKVQDGSSMSFRVLSEEQVKKIPSMFRGTLSTLEKELEGKDNFTMAVGIDEKDDPEDANGYYQVILTEGGKKIRIIELRRDYKYENAFYDFTGTADK